MKCAKDAEHMEDIIVLHYSTWNYCVPWLLAIFSKFLNKLCNVIVFGGVGKSKSSHFLHM
jgi:hypothetical protein